MDYKIDYNYQMISGQHEAQRRIYKKVIGKSGRIFLIPIEENCADYIHVSAYPEGVNKKSDGYGGSTLEFNLENGSAIKLQGPWHTNAYHLLDDTGIDITDKHLTFVVISEDRQYDKNGNCTMKNVLYKDGKPITGEFDRGKKLAQEFANKLDKLVCCYIKSLGGSSNGLIKPGSKIKDNKLVSNLSSDQSSIVNF